MGIRTKLNASLVINGANGCFIWGQYFGYHNNPLHANATAAVPSHFNHPGHSITDIELISFELQPTPSMSRRKAREAYLINGAEGNSYTSWFKPQGRTWTVPYQALYCIISYLSRKGCKILNKVCETGTWFVKRGYAKGVPSREKWCIKGKGLDLGWSLPVSPRIYKHLLSTPPPCPPPPWWRLILLAEILNSNKTAFTVLPALHSVLFRFYRQHWGWYLKPEQKYYFS